MANELIERAALAASGAFGYEPCLVDAPDVVKSLGPNELSGDDWRNVARAVLQAIREPSIELQNAAFKRGGCGGHLDCWRAMIDAALAED